MVRSKGALIYRVCLAFVGFIIDKNYGRAGSMNLHELLLQIRKELCENNWNDAEKPLGTSIWAKHRIKSDECSLKMIAPLLTVTSDESNTGYYRVCETCVY